MALEWAAHPSFLTAQRHCFHHQGFPSSRFRVLQVPAHHQSLTHSNNNAASHSLSTLGFCVPPFFIVLRSASSAISQWPIVQKSSPMSTSIPRNRQAAFGLHFQNSITVPLFPFLHPVEGTAFLLPSALRVARDFKSHSQRQSRFFAS